MDAIVTSGLSKRYENVQAVDHLDLSVRRGELFALLGVNGAGKTTTIRMLCCLTKPSEGSAWLGGHSVVTETAAVKRLLGVSPQETAVAPNLTVVENLMFMGGVYGFSLDRRKERAAELAERFGLTGILRRRAGKLSGGWQRRLGLAMALVGEPEILFFDEPTQGLDVLARNALWETIRILKGKVTIVLTTHDMEEAEALSDRVGVMRAGRLLALGTVEELKARADAKRFTDAFVSIVQEAEK